MIGSGKNRLLKKLADSKLEERRLRKERDLERYKLEEMTSKNVYMRIMRKLKTKVDRIRMMIKKKNANKIKEYLLERDQEELQELSILQEEMGEFGKLRIFSGKSIPQEERKPPVTSREVSLSKYELEVLSKNPKFVVKALMSKEKY